MLSNTILFEIIKNKQACNIQILNFSKKIELIFLNSIPDVRDSLLNKYNISKLEYNFIEQVIIERQPHKDVNQWEFAGALYYVTVVVAMIGQWSSPSWRQWLIGGRHRRGGNNWSVVVL